MFYDLGLRPISGAAAESCSRIWLPRLTKVKNDLESSTGEGVCDDDISHTVGSQLTEFVEMSEEEIYKIIMKSRAKSCSLDPLPTWLLKNCIGTPLPTMTKIINRSLTTG